MKQKYFIHNGKVYYSGTQIVVKMQDRISGKMTNINAIFEYFNTDKNLFAFTIHNCTYIYPEKMFYQVFVKIGDIVIDCCDNVNNNVMPNNQKHTFSQEIAIEGLLLAWMWYIFIMTIAFIFNGRIGIWILASVIFFDYRNKKLRKAGLK